MTTDNPSRATATEKKPSAVVYATLAWLPFLVSLVSVPVAVFFPNLIDFNYELAVIMPFLGAALAAFVVLWAFARFGPNWGHQVLFGLFFVGVYLLLSDLLTPVQWGLLDGDNLPSEPRDHILIELAIAAGVIACAFVLPRRVIADFGMALTVVFLLTQVVSIGTGIAHWAKLQEQEELAQSASAAESASAAAELPGNIYHFVFDGFSSLGFLDLAQQTAFDQGLSDFTFYERTLANYITTDESMSSFLTGNLYKEGSFNQWRRTSRNGGLRAALEEAGYSIEVHIPDRNRPWMYDGAAHIRTSRDISVNQHSGSGSYRLFHVSSVRLAPTFLRHEVLALTNSNPYSWYKTLSVPLIEQFLDEEASRAERGRYVYLHVVLPHAPFLWDSQCQPVENGSYKDQRICSLRLMNKMLDQLKALGRYDASAIVIQSDHGYHLLERDSALEAEASQAVKDKISAIVRPKVGLNGFFRRIHPLLLVKPPHRSGTALEVSALPTQLIDVPATVTDMAGVSMPATDGASVLRLDPLAPRERQLFLGVKQIGKNGSTQVLGKSMAETKLLNLSYIEGKGWQINPDLPAFGD